MLLPDKYKDMQTDIVCNALKEFNPKLFAQISSEEFEVVPINAGNMSYGFKIHTKSGDDFF